MAARRVFLSAPFDDLVEFRQAALEGIRRAGCVAVTMEDFSAHPNPADRRDRGEVDTCEAVVAVVAHRYGNSPTPGGRSYTELECRHAVEDLGLPLYAFLVDEKFEEWPKESRDGYELMRALAEKRLTPELVAQIQAKAVALESFKAWLATGRVKRWFRTPKDLSIEVERALTSPGESDADTSLYFDWLREYCAWIELRGLQVGSGKAHRFPIEDLYIPLMTASLDPTRAPDDEAGRRDHVPLEQALSLRKLVIEGGPGSGKSTFLRKIAREVQGFPILVRIADLDEYMHKCDTPGRPANLVSPEWIPHYLASRKWGLDARFFDRRLHHSNTTLMLDGLDEAPDRLRRENFARLFEDATRIYKECRFVVTTRPLAYAGAAVLSGFEKVTIQELGDDAVAGFLKRWSACLHPKSEQAAEAHRAELVGALDAREEIKRMARNPVMLTALAVVHWNERRLPEQRADLYESIVLWLARSREQRSGRTPASVCLEWLGFLALEMQTVPGGRKTQVGKGVAADLLAGRLEEPAAHKVAKEFLDQEEVDSGIVVSQGNELKFWHLTFQEYLAARALAGQREAVLHAEVLKDARLFHSEWREVMTLLAGVLHSQGREKVNALFDAVLREVGDGGLADHVRRATLLSAMVRDLAPTGYVPSSEGYGKVLASMSALFDKSTEEIGPRLRVEAAEALGVDHPRLRVPADNDYWISIPAGKKTGAFKIGRYAVTVFEYAKFVKAGGREPYEWKEQARHPSRPVVYVNWNRAKAYCEWAGARLLTDVEWTHAAYGREGRSYPWGTMEPNPDLANCKETGIGAPTPVGLFPNGNTPEGVADMIGNVWEWIEDWYEENKSRMLRGGAYYMDAGDLGPPARYRDLPGVSRYGSFGFRCARD